MMGNSLKENILTVKEIGLFLIMILTNSLSLLLEFRKQMIERNFLVKNQPKRS